MPKRKAQGEGSMRKRADGRWECRVTVGRDPGTGKQVRKSFYAPTQGELVTMMKQVQADLENGAFVEPSKLTVGQWLDTWAADYLGNISEGTKTSYEGIIKKHINPTWGRSTFKSFKRTTSKLCIMPWKKAGKQQRPYAIFTACCIGH
ncbi:MAG: hypothetical protein LBV27_09510 [Oscillospiraceae bacterium]|jgi:hypothetical protein|nr:hypothetical protein [Oscillospiraceae bacterium]